ncbi:hypothetical protein LguiB_028734 [Lonicera macranthoides]
MFRPFLAEGSSHDVDSSVLAFKQTAHGSYRERMKKVGPKLLEPIMRVEVVTSKKHLGDPSSLFSILSSAAVRYVNCCCLFTSVAALVALLLAVEIWSLCCCLGALVLAIAFLLLLAVFAELVQCVSTLRGITEGRDSNSIQLAKFDVVPHHVQNQLSAKEEVVAS